MASKPQADKQMDQISAGSAIADGESNASSSRTFTMNLSGSALIGASSLNIVNAANSTYIYMPGRIIDLLAMCPTCSSPWEYHCVLTSGGHRGRRGRSRLDISLLIDLFLQTISTFNKLTAPELPTFALNKSWGRKYCFGKLLSVGAP
jgi:hypothetical protein